MTDAPCRIERGRIPGVVETKSYQVAPNQRILLRKGSPVRIQEKPLSLLLHFLHRSGKLVPRDELRQELWPSGTYVDFDHGLSVAAHKLCVALEDASDCPRFIETVVGQGYRFIAPVVGKRSRYPHALRYCS